jgi:hypothetical protein
LSAAYSRSRNFAAAQPHKLTMKIAALLWLCLSLVASVAQDTSKSETPPGVTIRGFKWQKANAGLTVDASFKAESDSVRSDPSSPTTDPGSDDRATLWFLYSVEIQNDGTKSIKAIRWDYVIVDRNSHEELGRHIFDNFEIIGSNKTKSLNARSRRPPTTVVRVPKAGENDKPDVVEKVTLKCIVYDDGSVWEQPGIPAKSCDSLRRGTKN